MEEKQKPFCPIRFDQFDRISDVLLYFNQDFSLRFNVKLSFKNRNGGRSFFSREYGYSSPYYNIDYSYSIRRDLTFFYTINNKNNYQDSVVIKPHDVVSLKVIFETIMNWFVGPKRIFGVVNKELVIKGRWRRIMFPLSDYQYIAFTPIVIEYEDHNRVEGLHMEINNPENTVDIDITKFFTFYYIICNTDMYACANSMINFAQSNYRSEGIQLMESRKDPVTYVDPNAWGIDKKPPSNNDGNFFDKIK